MTSSTFRSLSKTSTWGWSVAVSGLVCLGCDSKAAESHGTFSAPNELEAGVAAVRWGATTAERFGLSRGASLPKAKPAASSTPASESPGKTGSEWTTPKGWTELEPTSMRTGNWRVAGDPRAECYLTILGGDAGGLAANVNRWRTQMGLGAMSRDELEGLERVEFLGGLAPMVDFEGTFSGMIPGGSAGAPQSGYRLVGALKVDPNGSVFVKMTGPSDVIGKELQSFKLLVASLGKSSSESTDSLPAGQASSPSPNPPFSSDDLTWSVPQGWEIAPPRPARVVTFYVDENREVECYVTSLAGEAGGALANINRWNKQMGVAELADLAQLQTIAMQGTSAYLVEVDGTYSIAPSAPPAPASLLGAVQVGPQGSTFVKLIGPKEIVRQQRPAFLSFCASLRSRE